MDQIFVEGLVVEAIIGILPEERLAAQPIIFDIYFSVDIREAAQTEDIAQTVSYATVAERVSALAINGRYQLVETLAEAVANVLMGEFGVSWVQVKVSKPKAVESAAAVGVLIERGIKVAD